MGYDIMMIIIIIIILIVIFSPFSFFFFYTVFGVQKILSTFYQSQQLRT